MKISRIIKYGLYVAIIGGALTAGWATSHKYDSGDKSRREEIKRFKEYMSKEGIKVNEDNIWVCSIGVPHYPVDYLKFVDDIDQKTMSDPEKLAPYVKFLEQNNIGPYLFLLEDVLKPMKYENKQASVEGGSFFKKLHKIHAFYDKQELKEEQDLFNQKFFEAVKARLELYR